MSVEDQESLACHRSTVPTSAPSTTPPAARPRRSWPTLSIWGVSRHRGKEQNWDLPTEVDTIDTLPCTPGSRSTQPLRVPPHMLQSPQPLPSPSSLIIKVDQPESGNDP